MDATATQSHQPIGSNSVVLWVLVGISDRIHSKYLRTSGRGYDQDLGVMEVTIR
jgi:hypothetical protein